MPKSFASALTAAAFPNRPTRSLTASARTSRAGENGKTKLTRQGFNDPSTAWQKEAWGFYDTVGELHYTMSFIGACLSRCRLIVGVPDDDGHVGPAFDDEGQIITDRAGNVRPELANAKEALELIRALKSEIGGQAELLRSMGINIGLAGELHLVGTPKTKRQEGETVDLSNTDLRDMHWEALSTEEFKTTQNDNYERKRGPGYSAEEIKPTEVHAIRIWRPHPRFSEMPDSSVQAVLEVLEELSLLSREVKGDIMSRLANAGILFMPNEIEYPEPADHDPDEDGDAFTQDLIETMSTAIREKGSAAQLVPLVVRAPGEQIKNVLHLKFPLNPAESIEKRKDAVLRFAQGVDLPVETVTGHAETTFANAVVIDDATFKSHIEPVLEIIASALTAGFLRPALGDETPFVVHYDAAELLNRPNKAQDGKDLHDRMVISDAALRSSAGFSDSDAPDEEEIERRQNRKVATTPNTQPVQPRNPESAQDGPGSDAPGSTIEQGTGEQQDPITAGALAIAEFGVERAIVRAGARLRSKANKLPAQRDLLSQVPDAEVAVTLGRTMVERMAPEGLFVGEFESLQRFIARKTNDYHFAQAVATAAAEIAAERIWNPTAPFPQFKFEQRYELAHVG